MNYLIGPHIHKCFFLSFQTFYSVSLSRGQISAWLRNGQDEMITVGSTDAYNDNEAHSVSIQKIGREYDIILYNNL